MNFTRYPIIIILITIVIVFIFWYLSFYKTIEGVENKETEKDAKKISSINQTIISFTQDLYSKMKNLITVKTQESEKKTIDILKKVKQAEINIENSNQVDPKDLEKWSKLKKIIDAKKLEFNAENNMKENPGVTIEILSENERDKIRGIINKYL